MRRRSGLDKIALAAGETRFGIFGKACKVTGPSLPTCPVPRPTPWNLGDRISPERVLFGAATPGRGCLPPPPM